MMGVVQEIGRTQKGAPYVVIDGTRYYASQCQTPPTGLTTGMRVEFTASAFGNPGRDGKQPMGLNTWKPVLDAAGAPQTASTVTEADILRTVSNIVGSACAAGTIKDAVELEKWFIAAGGAISRLLAPQTREPGQDDEPPFDDSAELAALAEAKQRGNRAPW
jgi:hypothetical protein